MRADFIVLDGLPEELRHGVFKTPRTFDALIRLSAGNIEVQEDTIPQAAGMAIKRTTNGVPRKEPTELPR